MVSFKRAALHLGLPTVYMLSVILFISAYLFQGCHTTEITYRGCTTVGKQALQVICIADVLLYCRCIAVLQMYCCTADVLLKAMLAQAVIYKSYCGSKSAPCNALSVFFWVGNWDPTDKKSVQ